MTRRAPVALLAAALIAALAGSGRVAGAEAGTHRQPVPARVLVIGDSNTGAATPDLDRALRAASLDPQVVAVPGFGLKDLDTYWMLLLPGLLRRQPRVVVVALGANDVDTGDDVAAFHPRLERLMAALGHRPVVWVTHYEDRGKPASYRAHEINRTIRAARKRWSNLTVLDLARVLAAHPSLLGIDRLHFTERGLQVFARDLARAARVAALAVNPGG